MLDEAVRSYLDGFVGGDGLDIDDIKREWSHLPETFGGFEPDAVWVFQVTDSDWIEIIESEKRFGPYSMDRIFDKLPEAADWPRD